MNIPPERIATLAQTMGVPATDLAGIIDRGSSHAYKAGDYLYHESTPRLWMGIVEEGEIEIVRGLHGHSLRLATLTPGTGSSEGVMLDDLPHSGSAIALTAVRVWQIPCARFSKKSALQNPNSFIAWSARSRRRLSARLRAAGEQPAAARRRSSRPGPRSMTCWVNASYPTPPTTACKCEPSFKSSGSLPEYPTELFSKGALSA